MFLVAAGLMLSPSSFDAISDARHVAGQETIRVGRVVIEGNTVTADRVILNQLGVRPGHRLRYEQLEEGRLNLIRTGLFDEEEPVTVEVVAAKAEPFHRDVRVRVTETRTGGFFSGTNISRPKHLSRPLTLTKQP